VVDKLGLPDLTCVKSATTAPPKVPTTFLGTDWANMKGVGKKKVSKGWNLVDNVGGDAVEEINSMYVKSMYGNF